VGNIAGTGEIWQFFIAGDCKANYAEPVSLFSHRFTEDLSPNALSLLLREKRTSGQIIFDLTASNPTRVGLTYDDGEILAALSLPAAMTYAPDPHGLLEARRSIGQYYRELGVSIEADDIFLTASTSEAYAILFKLLGNPDDEILIPRPGYPLLAHLAWFENLQPISYPLRYDDAQGWFIDLDVLEALITPKSRAIVVVSPNNPTGNYVKQTELAVLDQICRRNHLALIVDEVFGDFPAMDAPQPSRTVLNRSEALSFVLNGFSKMLGLPQVKLGWIAVGGEPGLVQAARTRLEVLLDFYLSVATPVQHAVARLLATCQAIQEQIHARIAANGRFMEEQIQRTSSGRVLKREGGWYGIIEISDALTDEERVLQLLERQNTLVHPGYFYDFQREGCVVISLLPHPEMFQTGITRLSAQLGRQ
jgi:alanine-synthesizing transaminase